MKDNTISIRQLMPKDIPLWKTIRLDALKTVPEAFASSYEEESSLSDRQFEKGLLESEIFGAFIDNNLVGTAGFFTYKQLKMQHRGSLFGMYVSPEYRTQGVATQLIQTIINCARKKVIQLHCSVVTKNTLATQFYMKHGFTIYGTEARALKVGNTFYDEHLMILNFE